VQFEVLRAFPRQHAILLGNLLLYLWRSLLSHLQHNKKKKNKLLGRPGCIIEEQRGLGGNQSKQLEEEMLWGGRSLLEA